MIRVLNYKPFQRGAIIGFFDLGIAGLVIKGCRLMYGKEGGFWFAFPQREGKDESGSAKYFDIIHMAKPEMDHVRRLVVAELEMQGHIEHVKGPVSKPRPAPAPKTAGSFRHPDTNEDLSMHVTTTADDDIPF